MATPALYDILYSFKDISKVVLDLAAGLSDEQLQWKPKGYSTSIGFHLWQLAREADYLKAAILAYNRQFVPEFSDGKEIWEKEGLAQKRGFPDALHKTVGTGLSIDRFWFGNREEMKLARGRSAYLRHPDGHPIEIVQIQR